VGLDPCALRGSPCLCKLFLLGPFSIPQVMSRWAAPMDGSSTTIISVRVLPLALNSVLSHLSSPQYLDQETVFPLPCQGGLPEGRKDYAASMPEYRPRAHQTSMYTLHPASRFSFFFVGVSCPAEFSMSRGRYGCQHTLPIDEFQHFFWDGLSSFKARVIF
jgi:hypothetical protein